MHHVVVGSLIPLQMSLTWLIRKCFFQAYSKGSLRSCNERGWSSVQDRHPIARVLYLYWLLARGGSPNTCYTHCTGSTLQLVHMLHSLYCPILTALHKDAMLYNDTVPGTMGLTRGRGPEAPLHTLRAYRSPTAYTPPVGIIFN